MYTEQKTLAAKLPGLACNMGSYVVLLHTLVDETLMFGILPVEKYFV